jgi:erythronate-4-phosphate dehydrogenase
VLRENLELFEQLRGDYPVRREFGFYSVQATGIKPELVGNLEQLGFKILDDNQ